MYEAVVVNHEGMMMAWTKELIKDADEVCGGPKRVGKTMPSFSGLSLFALF